MLCSRLPPAAAAAAAPAAATTHTAVPPLTAAAARTPSGRRRCTIAIAALPGWLQQLVRSPSEQRPRRATRLPEAAELFGLLTDQQPAAVQAIQRRRINELLDALLDYSATGSLPFDEQLLGGGPWRVLFTRGSLQLWKLTYTAGRLVQPANAASQDLDPSGGRRGVINKAEFLGDRLFVTASGRYEPLGDAATLPQDVQANITEGALHLLGARVPLPIRGTGRFTIIYLDDRLRVFRSGGALAVQVKEACLPAAAAAAAAPAPPSPPRLR